MKRNIHKNLLGMLKSKGILAVSSGLLLMSCGAQVGGYSETDGVYYDPNKDTLPEGVIINGDQGNRVGEYYDYYPESNIVENSQINSSEYDHRYDSWSNTNNGNATDSDWGNFAGNETNIYDNSWGWGMGFGSPWGWYGGYSPYWGSGWGMSFGWGSSWGWGGYSPYWGMGWNSPYWGYNPYWGYGGGYGGWYGGAGYWGGNYYRPVYRRSGANGGGFTNNTIGINKYNGNGSGFRNGNNGSGMRNGAGQGGFRNNNGGFRQGTTSGGFRQGTMNGGFRNQSGNRPNYQQTRPNYNNTRPNYNQQQSQPRSYDNGGFRSGGFNSGSSGGGGFRSGGSSGGGGGMRSGGGGGGFRSGGR